MNFVYNHTLLNLLNMPYNEEFKIKLTFDIQRSTHQAFGLFP